MRGRESLAVSEMTRLRLGGVLLSGTVGAFVA